MLTQKMKMNTKVPPASEPDDVVVISKNEDFYRLKLHPDCVCVAVECDSVEDGAFQDMLQLRQVILREGVTYIGDKAFSGCRSLREIDLPDSVEYLGYGAFENCVSLEKVRLSHGLDEILLDTFLSCKKLREIRIPPAVDRIQSGAFEGCTELERVCGCEGLVTVELNAFLNCKSLKSFPFAPYAGNIHVKAFEGSPLRLPATYFHAQSTRAKYGNKDVAVPEGIQTIGACAFRRGNRMNRIALPDSVRNISRYAFCGSEFYEYVPDDYVNYLPVEMNMPKGYLRQQEQFDALMALTLCDTVWKKYARYEDIACIALFQNDKTARFLALDKLKRNDNPFPAYERKKAALKFMLDNYRRIPSDLLHIAEFLSYFLIKINDSELIDRIHGKAVQCGAWEAAELLEKYCRPRPEGLPYICTIVSPYEADWLLREFAFGRESLIGESELRYTSGEDVPKEFVRSMVAASLRESSMKAMQPGYFCGRLSETEDEFKKAFDSVCASDWLLLLQRNPKCEKLIMTMMCRYASDDMLERLYEHCCRLLETSSRAYKMVITADWLEAFEKNNSFASIRIRAQLQKNLDDMSKDETYENNEGNDGWGNLFDDCEDGCSEHEETDIPDDWEFEWEKEYSEEGMDIFGEHYADEYEEECGEYGADEA